MLEFSFDYKTVTAIIASAFSIGSFLPYLWQIFKRQTKPHAYTWLIWTFTVGTAAAGIWYGGGGLILTISMVINVALVALVFLLSFKYGTKNITRGDTVLLVLALLAIFMWWGLNNPVLAVIMATGIDLLGYWPTYRKSFSEPWSENVLAWVGYALAPAFALIALFEYNWLTATYPAAVLVANVALVLLLLIRRRSISRPT